MKKLFKLVVVLLVLIIAGVVAAFFYIDAIAKAAIERGSTHALKVDTKLNSASLKVFKGQLIMGGLNVSNPQGYKSAHFLTMKDGDVEVSLGSLQKNVVEVPHLRLTDIDMNLEKKDGKANYQVILDNLKGSETEPKPQTKEAKRFIIKELSIKNVQVHLDMPALTRPIDIPIDEIKMHDVGSGGEKGVMLKDLSGMIVKAIFKAAILRGGSQIPAEIAAELTKGLAELTDINKLANVDGIGKSLGDKANELADKAKEGIDKATGAIGDMLGGDKKKK